MQPLVRIRSAYGRLLTACGWIAGALTFAVMCMVVANVTLRYLFNASVPGTFELTEGALPFIIFLSLALTQFHGGHIRVVLLTDRLPDSMQRMLGMLGLLAGALLFAWAAWAGWSALERSWAINEIERGSIRYPIWPVRLGILFGMALLTLQFLLDAIFVALGGSLGEPHAEEIE